MSEEPTLPVQPSPLKPLLGPIDAFLSAESAGGIVLLAATLIALAWANSPWSDAYHHLWETQLTLSLGGRSVGMSLHHLVNDGLMAVFFLMAGLEIKRELLLGELASFRRAALPVAAAIGGMLVPAAIFVAFNFRNAGSHGWGIPMATDIAFAVGVLAVVGRHVPMSVKVLLLAIAIVDDLGAVLVIAFFYTSQIHLLALGIAGVFLAALIGLNLLRVNRPFPYILLGLGLWAATLSSGIHATIAGVLLAFTIPARRLIGEKPFHDYALKMLDIFAFESIVESSKITPVQSHAIQAIEKASHAVQTLLARVEHALLRPVNFLIIPLFALANAGLDLRHGLTDAVANPVAWGVLAGLLAGKPIGILLASWIATKSGLAAMPDGATRRQIVGVSLLCGVGFTMSLFVANLAYPGAQVLMDAAKLGILTASLCSGLVGGVVIAWPGRAKAA